MTEIGGTYRVEFEEGSVGMQLRPDLHETTVVVTGAFTGLNTPAPIYEVTEVVTGRPRLIGERFLKPVEPIELCVLEVNV